jgi:hypothetical protein
MKRGWFVGVVIVLLAVVFLVGSDSVLLSPGEKYLKSSSVEQTVQSFSAYPDDISNHISDSKVLKLIGDSEIHETAGSCCDDGEEWNEENRNCVSCEEQGKEWNGEECVCPEGTEYVGEFDSCLEICTGGRERNEFGICACPDDEYWDTGRQECIGERVGDENVCPVHCDHCHDPIIFDVSFEGDRWSQLLERYEHYEIELKVKTERANEIACYTEDDPLQEVLHISVKKDGENMTGHYTFGEENWLGADYFCHESGNCLLNDGQGNDFQYGSCWELILGGGRTRSFGISFYTTPVYSEDCVYELEYVFLKALVRERILDNVDWDLNIEPG